MLYLLREKRYTLAWSKERFSVSYYSYSIAVTNELPDSTNAGTTKSMRSLTSKNHAAYVMHFFMDDLLFGSRLVFARNETKKQRSKGEKRSRERREGGQCILQRRRWCRSGLKVNSPNIGIQAEYRCTVPFAASFPWVMVNYGCLILPAWACDYRLREEKRERERGWEQLPASLPRGCHNLG